MVVKTITTRPPEASQLSDRRRNARMSIPEVGRRLRDELGIGISEVGRRLRNELGIGISDSQIWRICSSSDLKPWLVPSWMTSHDPHVDDQAADVCDLYLYPPENAVVFCIDEKTGMQAKSRTNPTRPAQPATATTPGRRAQQEFEYARNGTAALYAALNVGDGNVERWVTHSTRSENFVHFLRHLDTVVVRRAGGVGRAGDPEAAPSQLLPRLARRAAPAGGAGAGAGGVSVLRGGCEFLTDVKRFIV